MAKKAYHGGAFFNAIGTEFTTLKKAKDIISADVLDAWFDPYFSNPYTVFNTQLTYSFKKVEVYGGAENLFDFRQRQPIISWQNPFSPFFDTSSVWGPTRGREVYVGIRLKLTENSTL